MEGLFTGFILVWCFAGGVIGQNFSCNTVNSLRLNPGSYFAGNRLGRVEICSCDSHGLSCEWSTITIPSIYTSWGWKNALVACREIYPEDYGATNPILQDTLPETAQAPNSQLVASFWVMCDGTEAKVSDCMSFQTSVTSHARDAHIQCRSGVPLIGDIRLTGHPGDSYQGIVEYYQGGAIGWVTVCTDAWNPVDAIVACIQLGYESGIVKNLQASFFGTNYGPVGVYSVVCGGSEVALSSCFSTSSGTCTDMSVRAGVECTFSGLSDGSSRLTTTTLSGTSQQVEVLYDGRWGTVCRQGWDTNDGNVVCRSLGLGVAFIENSPTIINSLSDIRPIWLSELTCVGSESSLAECTTTVAIGYTPSCTHTEDAVLACVPEDRFCNIANTLRLNQDGYFSNSRAGRVEICNCDLTPHGCEWATVAVQPGLTSWGWKNAQVACRQLFSQDYGVTNPLLQDTLPVGVQAPSSQFVHSSYILCDGTESNLDQCSRLASSDRSHTRDAYIQCQLNEPMSGDIRLTGGTVDSAYGIVELYDRVTRRWTTLCSDSWDDEDATVACAQLGYESGTAQIYQTSTFTGSNYGDVGIYEVSCTGDEAYLDDCSYNSFGSCTNVDYRGGVSCVSSDLGDGTLRLDPSLHGNSIQRVEVLYDGRWGTVCNANWEVEDAMVVCRALGYNNAGIADSSSLSPEGYGNPIWLTTVTCEGSESSLTECITTLPVGYVPSCTHEEDAAITCVDEGLSGGEIAGIVIGSVAGVCLIMFIIIYSDPNQRKKWAAKWNSLKQSVRNTFQNASRRFRAWKTSLKTRRTGSAEARAAALAARQSAAREAANREAANREATNREAANREAIAREEAAMAETTRTEQASAEVYTATTTSQVEQGVSPAEEKLRELAPPSYDDVVQWNAATMTIGPPSTLLPLYPTTNQAELPYPVSNDVQVYPPPSNPGYPLVDNPAFPPHIFPLPEPTIAPSNHPNQPLGVTDIDVPLPPLLQPAEDEVAF